MYELENSFKKIENKVGGFGGQKMELMASAKISKYYMI